MAEANDPQFALQKIYIKDASFESPNPAKFFSEKGLKPEVNLNLNTESAKLSEDIYEVTLNITISAAIKDSDTTVYLVEVKQAGIFAMKNIPEAQLGQMINAYCPTVLFPYAREAISSLVERGGFPQLLLAPINFDALYQQHQAKLAESQAEASSESKH